MVRRYEEIILQQKPGEEEPVPLVVGQLFNKVRDLVSTRAGLALRIPQLPGLGAEFPPELALPLDSCRVGSRFMHGESFERLPCARRGDRARLFLHVASNWRRRVVGRLLIRSRVLLSAYP